MTAMHANVTLDESSYPLINGKALVMVLGKPPGIRSPGDYTNAFEGGP